jgi:hypothetical protein
LHDVILLGIVRKKVPQTSIIITRTEGRLVQIGCA